LPLDRTLKRGEFRYLTAEELDDLRIFEKIKGKT